MSQYTESAEFQQSLAHYADLIVKVGLNVQPHQRLLIRGAPLEQAPVVRSIVTAAYKAGCRLVSVQWNDELLTLARFQHAPRDSFAEFADGSLALMAEATERGDAVLSIDGSDPQLLQGQDPELVSTTLRISSTKARPHIDKIVNDAVNWCVVSVPTKAWAKTVFPNLGPEAAVDALWKAIFKTTRCDLANPVGAWMEHLATLEHYASVLNAKDFAAVRFQGPGTDLRVGLVPKHRWLSGRSRSQTGIDFVANMPTEEVFTLPHKQRVDGVVSSTKPLSYGGVLIDGIRVRFEDGKVVEATAAQGEEALVRLLDTDDGARRIGEVALVPHRSPISQSGILFNNTLFDENAACHIALGRAYNFTLQGGVEMGNEAFFAAGGNDSSVHVDWMIGSGEISVLGEHNDGRLETILERGDWVLG